jgi:4-hydroxy-tetrahydrodipicolinate reductase
VKKKTAVCVVGARGRMGQHLVRLLETDDLLALAGALDKGDAAEAAIAKAKVVVDFSAPAAAHQLLPLAAKYGVAYLVASTALRTADEAAIEAAAKRIAIVQAANLSLGVNVLALAVEQVARRLGPSFDVEIVEAHHRHKKDAPSGTALLFGQAARRGRPALRDVLSRPGGSPRQSDELGYAVVRGGDISGEHTIHFLGDGERVELSHRASTPDIFARGALVAARWLVGRAPGRYGMLDVLGRDAST